MQHSCKQLIKIWPMLRRTMTWFDLAVVDHTHPNEDEEHVEWEHPEKGYFDVDPVQVRAGVEREMAFMRDSVLVNRATVRKRERSGQHDGVTDAKVTQCEADLCCDSSECTCGQKDQRL